jgi:hypothetical protein
MKLFLDSIILISALLTAFLLGTLFKALPEIVTVTEYVIVKPIPPKPVLIRPTKEEDQVIVNWIKDKEAVDLMFEEYYKENGIKPSGLAHTSDGYCNIWAYDYQTLESEEAKVFLHEVTHCFKGSFHAK